MVVSRLKSDRFGGWTEVFSEEKLEQVVERILFEAAESREALGLEVRSIHEVELHEDCITPEQHEEDLREKEKEIRAEIRTEIQKLLERLRP